MTRTAKQFEIPQSANVDDRLQQDFESHRIDLKEFTKILRIGDRIRVFCDDGVLVAEKISRTQFRVIQAETMTELIH